MCGIAGLLNLDGSKMSASRCKKMIDVMAHRGPDDAGYVFIGNNAEGTADFPLADPEFLHLSPGLAAISSAPAEKSVADNDFPLFMGQRRLAILDPTPRGHQPMQSHDGSCWLIYNGEVYNFRELRSELKKLGHTFVSETDTEVVLAAYMEWGAGCVGKFNGMFALAIWDCRCRKLFLARDRYGIKPLYYRRDDKSLSFASEIKPLMAVMAGGAEVDLLALNEYFSFQNNLGRRTLFEGIHTFPPAHTAWVDSESGECEFTRYWDFDFSANMPSSVTEIQEELHRLIAQAVERQCVSDVPVGSYLSGGMDSGTVTALATGHLGRITTFTGGFDLSEATNREQSFDERELAEHMASILQTEHYECVLHAGDLPAILDRLVWHLEDLRVGQCYPNYYLARLAGHFVKVVLSGMGGDELFGGYPWRYAAALGPTHEDYIKNYYRYWKRLVRNRDKPQFFTEKVSESLRQLDDNGAVPFKDQTLRSFQRVFPKNCPTATGADQINGALYFECKTFLHGLLTVEDRLSMAHSLETRVPFLDNDLVDFACAIPVDQKVFGLEHLQGIDENLVRKKNYYQEHYHTGKNVLRRSMEKVLPDSVTQARKQGFSAPDESWFRGRAEGWVRDTLLATDARINEYINPAAVRRTIDSHTRGENNHRLLIWSLLCFNSWLGAFRNVQ